MASLLDVSAGNLDNLVGLTVPVSEFTGLSVQSFTLNNANLSTETLASLNATDTGLPGPATTTGVTVSVVAVNDAQNSVTLGLDYGGVVQQITDYAVGFGPDGVLLALDNSNVMAGNLSLNFNVSDDFAVLSAAPIAQGTALSFSATGTTSPPTPPALSILDTTTNQPLAAASQPYSGPVAGLTSQFVTTTTDSLNVTVTTPNWFIHTGSGNDAIAVSSGTNVLDGSTGSNFLTGGTGADTFFVDDRGATSNIWSTVNNFHSGDAATIWGITPSDFTLTWLNGQGAAGYTGLTLGATAAGQANATLTLVGFTSADLTNGRLTVSFGTTAATDGVPGSNYMLIKAN